MNLPALLFLAFVSVGCISALGLIVIGVFATLLRRDATRITAVFSFTFLAAALGVFAILMAFIAFSASDPDERTAYLARWQPWLFFAALLAPHLLWFRRARRPIPAAIIATLATVAATPEFLDILAGV